MKPSHGNCEGDKCGRNGCAGVIQSHPVENCSCHISPPCSQCTTPRGYCPTCGWEERDDTIINDYVVNVNPTTGVHRFWEPRQLDRTKIDWRSHSHTNASMRKEGCFPKGTPMEEVRKYVNGTFGGRFTKFDTEACEFEFIAYTD